MRVLPLSGIRRTLMRVPILGLAILTLLDGHHPLVLQHLFDRRSRLGIRVQHPLQDRVTVLGHQVVQRLRSAVLSVLIDVLGVGRIRGVLGDPPGDFLELHAVKDDGTGPDIDCSGVVL
jgi:hypothetical protein